VRRVATVDELRRSSSGVYLAGRSWLHFCATPSLWGLCLFGRPDRDEAEVLVRSLSVELEPEIAPHAFFVDAAALEGVDPDAFEMLVAHYRGGLGRAREVYSRMALVVPRGVPGAVVTGFYGSEPPPFPTRVLDDADAALAWLGAAPDLAASLEGLVAEARGSSELVLRLRALLGEPASATDAEALGARLGMSGRTLQRRLTAEGTSLSAELAHVRIESAKRRLSESETPVTVIALDLGFSTSQHFSRQFRAATGLTPSAWRARARPPRRGP
jgi:AraC-like DNA-binding protein